MLTVSQLTSDIRHLLESEFARVTVEGEISNCRPWTTGHVYFTLKDAGAQIRAVMFRSAARGLKFRLEDGQRVIARGRVGVYDVKGEYQIVCDRLEPTGAGALQVAFEQLKRRLDAEGLFATARKRPLPFLPRKIGIVTSLDGAAVRDIVTVLHARYANAHLVIRPARVQGDGAAADVARGLTAIARVPGVDVVIVGRGGGSIEDLWAFNEEVVARAIAACPVPVISAVGHETDFTIADFVADYRAPTPSAAAGAVVGRKDQVCAQVEPAGRAAGCGDARARAATARPRACADRPAWLCRLAGTGRRCEAAMSRICCRISSVRCAAVSARKRAGSISSRCGWSPRDLRRRVARHTRAARRRQQPARRSDGAAPPCRALAPRITGRGARQPQPAGCARARLCGLLGRRPAHDPA